jgi:hypothetical protein
LDNSPGRDAGARPHPAQPSPGFPACPPNLTRVVPLAAWFAQRQERQDRLIEAWQELAQIVAGTATELNDLLTFYIHSQDNGYQAAELLEQITTSG